jgi:hypothetical protein
MPGTVTVIRHYGVAPFCPIPRPFRALGLFSVSLCTITQPSIGPYTSNIGKFPSTMSFRTLSQMIINSPSCSVYRARTRTYCRPTSTVVIFAVAPRPNNSKSQSVGHPWPSKEARLSTQCLILRKSARPLSVLRGESFSHKETSLVVSFTFRKVG